MGGGRMKDVTEKYKNMIESFECDFSLSLEKGYSFRELDKQILECDERLLNDIELLKELSCGVRHGLLKIVEIEA